MVLDHASEHPSRWGGSDVDCGQDRLHATDACMTGSKKAEVDRGQRAGVPTDMADKLKALERENREASGRPTRSCARQALILRRRSSTAGTSHDRVHRRSSRGAWGRADLQGLADRPLDLPRTCGPSGAIPPNCRRRAQAGCQAEDRGSARVSMRTSGSMAWRKVLAGSSSAKASMLPVARYRG